MSKSNPRGVHVSPGIYTAETEISYAVKSLGITTLGLVGETQRGPAFTPISVENWRDFQSMFGGTSTEKFKDTLYPKYELPYIAKSYLSESNQLQVCRVLGLSGYNAGPAWVITLNGIGEYDGSVLAVLRSRGYYDEYYKPAKDAANDDCGCASNVQRDYQRFYVGESKDASCTETGVFKPRVFDVDSSIVLDEYKPINSDGSECAGYKITSGKGYIDGAYFKSTAADYGKFNIKIKLSPEFHDTKKDFDYIYAVSMNPQDSDYILKVLGENNTDATCPIYVESLYDIAFQQGVQAPDSPVKGINVAIKAFAPELISDYCKLEPVLDIVTKPENTLTRSDVGKRFLADAAAVAANFTYHVMDLPTKLLETETVTDADGVNTVKPKSSTMQVGKIYTVKQFTLSDGKRAYYYVNTPDLLTVKSVTTSGLSTTTVDSVVTVRQSALVYVKSLGLYYRALGTETALTDVVPVTFDLNNYKSQYRFASTPWFVSDVKGDYNNIEVNRLFRFHTISDGNNANREIKVSIENIMPDTGMFDVVVRDINDVDESIMPLEKFSKCNLVPGTSNFIGFKIGTSNGDYETISKYITVELYEPNDGVVRQNSVPCGFMGYPHGFVNGYRISGSTKVDLKKPLLKYNCNYDEDIKARKQYFGLSSIVGVDIDAFTFKGIAANVEVPDHLTNGFHLDSRLNPENYDKSNKLKITVDGEEGYQFDTVSANARTLIYEGNPIISQEVDMADCIFNNVKLRKFTTYFYGGFDGWDVYRLSRTNTDNFKMTKYRGQYNEASGEGYAFGKITDPEGLGLNTNGITSDFYAYLAAYRQFANPEAVDINLFATPGIDLINNTLLSKEVIEMIEEERADSLYVATLPDKPAGAADYVDEMYSADDIVYELEDTEIDSNYTCVYYPWVKYFDADNNQFIYLPVTKDVVRNMAQTDNQSYSWFAPAGLERGDVNCVRAHYITRLSDEDVLYGNRINPVKTFASDGVKIWGQKNLQVAEGQLNRIAVRRLLLRMRKLISIACLSLIFSPNDAQTKQSLQSLITPIMDNIKANRGISDYRIEITSSTATLEDRRELNVRILFKPYSALEYILQYL